MFLTWLAPPRGRLFSAFLLFLLLHAASLPAAADDVEYRLGPGDRLRLNVFELPELSGEFGVGPGAQLSLPLLGRLAVGGLSLPELEGVVRERLLRSGGVKDPRVSVEIIAFRPFFILGAVQQPGQYPYLPDLTVIQAVSIAGGFSRFVSPDRLVDLELGRVRERFLATGEATAIAVARRARLQAERDAASDVAEPPLLVDLAGSARATEIMANERRLFEQRGLALKSEISLLASQKDIIADEITALEKQLVTKGRLAEINQQEMSEIDKLRQRDLIPLTRVLALRRSATEIESDRIQLVASISRAKQEVSRVDLALLNLRMARNNQIAESLKQADDEISQLSISRRAALGQLRDAEASVARTGLGVPSDDGLGDEVMVLRRTAAGTSEIKATDDTRLLPGDVVRIPARALHKRSVEPRDGATHARR